ncbi:MAG: winged helix-turn-helix domain-containing protein [Chloroflexota bacterium]
MPVIRITDATWDRLKRWAIPLEDSPEDAVRKVLDAAEEHLKYRDYRRTTDISNLPKKVRISQGKLPSGVKTPQQAYRLPILEALHELGGSASVDSILKKVEVKMKSLLKEIDYQKLPSGIEIRWRNTAMWERFNLVKDGLLKPNSPSGIWELTEKGEKEVKERKI